MNPQANAFNPVPPLPVRHRQPINWLHGLLAGGVAIFFAVFLIWPVAQIIRGGFIRPGGGITFSYLALIFQNPVLLRGLLNSAGIALAVTLITLAFSLPIAAITVRWDFRGRSLLSGLLLAPLILPPFVGAMGMRFLLGRVGPLSAMLGLAGAAGFDWLGKLKIFGVIAVECLALYPVMLLNLQAALANLDPAMEEAAANLGASRVQRFRKITLPLMRPGIFAGCTLVMIWSFTELGTPLMFDLNTVAPVQVFNQLSEIGVSPMPYALVVVLLLASATLYLFGKVLLGRPIQAATSKGGAGTAVRRLNGWRALAAALPLIVLVTLALLPHVMIILTSLARTGSWYRTVLPARFTTDHYLQALSDELAFPSVINSVEYASVATLIALVMGLILAVLVVRSRLPGRWLIDSVAMLPLAVPGLVLAFGYLSLSVWARTHLAHSPPWLDVQEHPAFLLIIAYSIRRLPYVVRSAAAGLEQTPRDLELAASNLGAKKSTVLFRITIPLIAANLVAGALLAFAFALLEVSDSLVLAQKDSAFPITRAIYQLAERLGDGIHIASALGVWAMILLALTVLAANTLLGKKLGAIFRV